MALGIDYNSGIPHTNGAPTHDPGTNGGKLAYDHVNRVKYKWVSGTTWEVDASGGGGGSVEGVTGDAVDNTDPANPIVNAVPYIFPDEMAASGNNAFQGGTVEGRIVNFSNTYLNGGGFPFFGMHGTDGVTRTSIGYYDDGGLFFSLESGNDDSFSSTGFSPLGVGMAVNQYAPTTKTASLLLRATGAELYASDPIDVTNGIAVATCNMVEEIGRYKRINTSTVDLTAQLEKHTYLIDATGGDKVLTLPPAASAYNIPNGGHTFIIKKIGSGVNTVTVDGNGSETIDGAATYVLSTLYQFVTVQTDGSNWYVISKG